MGLFFSQIKNTDIQGYKLVKVLGADLEYDTYFEKERLTFPDMLYLLLLFFASILFLLEIFFSDKRLNTVIFNLLILLPTCYLVGFPLKEFMRLVLFKLYGGLKIAFSLNHKVLFCCSAQILCCKYRLALLNALPILIINILLILLYFLPGHHHFVLSGSLLMLNAFGLRDIILIDQSLSLDPNVYRSLFTSENQVHVFTKVANQI